MKHVLFPVSALFLLLGEPSSAEEKTSPEPPLPPPFSGSILGMEVRADHLGIVLDVSESMQPALPTVRKSLRTKLPKTPLLLVDGCKLERPDPRPRIVNGTAPDTITAITVLAEKAGAAAILWISDLGDPPNKAGLEALEALLSEREIRLFVLSLRNKPTPSVRTIAIESEGNWELVSLSR